MLDGIFRLGVAQNKETHLNLWRPDSVQVLDDLFDEIKVQWFRPDNDRTGARIRDSHNLWWLWHFFGFSILHHGLFRPSVDIEQCLGQALRVGLLQLISPKLGITIHDGDGQIIYES